MSDKFLDKKVVVSGGSKGIGKAVALRLAREGADVGLIARNETELEAVTGEIRRDGRRAVFIPADLRTAAACDHAAERLIEALGGVDIFVHCAGDTKRGSLLDASDELWDQGFALKFYAAVRLTRALWPVLVQSKGCVVNIIGGFARTPDPDFVIGGAVNAALANFSKALSGFGKRHDVNVNAIHPGMTLTERLGEIFENEAKHRGETPEQVQRRKLEAEGIRRLGRPEDVAALVCFLCSPEARHIQGVAISVDGGATAGVY